MGTSPYDRLWKSLHAGGSPFAQSVLNLGATAAPVADAAAAAVSARPAPGRAGLHIAPKERRGWETSPRKQENNVRRTLTSERQRETKDNLEIQPQVI